MSERRKGTKTATSVVTEGAAQAALRRGPARELSAEEEKVMRMRLGAALPRTSELERADGDLPEDLALELAAMQIEAWMRWKEHLATVRAPARAPAAAPARAPTRPAAQPSRTKEKIVRALRKK
jgi:hypothetical protein